MLDRPQNIHVFMLYAEEDDDLKKQLESHLSLLNQQGHIDLWHEGKMGYSKNPDAAISNHLQKSQLILLLISANFLVPEVYGKYETDIRAAYHRQEKGETQIIPVILRPCLWQLDILEKLEPLPKGGYPVRSRHWESHDLAFQNIALGILNIVDELKKGSKSAMPPPLPNHLKSENKTNTDQDEIGLKLINNLIHLMYTFDPESGAQKVLPIVHKSLIKDSHLELSFKKYKFWKAYEKIHLYKNPVEIKSKKNSGRTSIGVLLNKEEGTEWIYTLKKIEDLGGINGQIRIFFPKNGTAAKITSISL